MIKFRELRERLSVSDRISICYKETLQYKNYITIKDVPDIYNDLTVYCIRSIESEFYKINDFEYDTERSSGNLVLLSCIEIVVSSQEELQGNTDCDKFDIGSIVKIVGEDTVGIVKEIHNDSNIEVDFYYEKDNYSVEPHQKNVTCRNLLLADDDDFRVGYLRYLSRRKYLHIYTQRDKERMSAILHQLKKAWETYPDLRLGQLFILCCANDKVMFSIEDEMFMEQLCKVFLEKE